MSNGIHRLGFHYFPDDRHYTEADLEAWLPKLQSMGARWLTLQANAARCIPEHFLRSLRLAGIEPVVQVRDKIGALSPTEITTLLRCYARWGVRYAVVYDRPNMRASWSGGAWGRRDLVERFLDHMIPLLKAARLAGMVPILPPLEPGGDYWSTSFLEATLAGLERRGHRSLLRELHLAIYAWTYDRPLDWGEGGPARWPDARPYHTPTGEQDHLGFRIWDWYAAIGDKFLPSPLPQLVLGGGAVPILGHETHTEAQIEQNLAIARLFQRDKIPPCVLSFAFHLLSAEKGSPEWQAAWFSRDDLPRPMARALLEALGSSSGKGSLPTEKIFKHYILFPSKPTPDFIEQWSALGEIVSTGIPVVGFSPEEARLARHVTLVGNREQIPERIAHNLRSAGCAVHRLRDGLSRDSSRTSEHRPAEVRTFAPLAHQE